MYSEYLKHLAEAYWMEYELLVGDREARVRLASTESFASGDVSAIVMRGPLDAAIAIMDFLSELATSDSRIYFLAAGPVEDFLEARGMDSIRFLRPLAGMRAVLPLAVAWIEGQRS
ncbi:MAG TPA: hypothetical protein VIY86_13765 [Pirellulaceae bacterium]